MVFAILWGVLLFLTVWDVEAQLDGCCFGRTRAAHGDTVLTLDSCCVKFVCNNGDIVHVHYGDGPGGCHEGCEFDGRVYDNGTKLEGLCAPLTCVNGRWKVIGGIEECCQHCYLYDTSHVFTFDNNYYNWDGPCNYSVVQTGLTHYPRAAVFTSFRPCFTATFCLHTTTFRNDPYTIITLRHVPGDSIFKILVNGYPYLVPEYVVQQVKSGPNAHPVLAWRDGYCLYLLGSSGLTVQHCPHRLDVWASPTHATNLHGLCGHFNFDPSDDMTARDGTVYPIHPNPLAFPESWRTNEQSSRLCRQPCEGCSDPTTRDACVASVADRENYRVQCGKLLHPVLGPDTELSHHVDACELDLCVLNQAGVSKADQLEWLDETVKITQNSKILLAKALGVFVPDPLFVQLEEFCVQGSTWKSACNTCGCADSGSFPVCTKIACQPNFVPALGDKFCTNGSRWQKGQCNGCVCINRGIVCSFNECFSKPRTSTSPQTVTTAVTPPPVLTCSLPRVAGSCGLRILRWYYDFTSGRCYTFYYTGCGGNHNRFETLEKCEAACGHFTTSRTVTPASPVPLRCYLRWDAGTCREADLKYYYAPDTGTCIPAYYTGCGGNDNRFDTFEECLQTCGGVGTTDVSTSATGCPSILLECPQDCGHLKFIIDPVTSCPKCVCEFITVTFPTVYTTSTCPPHLMICPTYCPVVMVSDPVTGCPMCMCSLPSVAQE